MTVGVTTGWLTTGSYDRATAEAAFGAGAYDARTVGHILDAVEADCAATGINPGCLLGQMAVETGWFKFGGQVSPWQWNYGGIGAVDGGAAGASFPTPEAGVHAMCAHHGNYYWGSFADWPPDWAWLEGYAIRNQQVVDAGWGGTVSVIGDYGGGRWATDPDYAGKIVARANELGATATPGGGGGMAPEPPIDRTHRSPNRGYSNGFTHEPELVVWHVTVGSYSSSLGWLCNPTSGASANYLLDKTGKINELVPPTESAWANGEVNKPDLSNPVIAQVDDEGCNYNQRTISIEIVREQSNYNKPGGFPPAQVEGLIALTAWLCDTMLIKPDRTHIIRHAQIDSVNRYYCPGCAESEMVDWIAEVARRCEGGDDQVKEPGPGKAQAYLNDKAETIVVINFAGVATRIKGVAYVDVGCTVEGDDGHDYSRSVINGEMKPWNDLGPTKP